MQVGDLVKFKKINAHTTNLNNKMALYLGEDFIHRDDGVIVENHKVLLVGESTPTIIDRRLLWAMTKVEKKDAKRD